MKKRTFSLLMLFAATIIVVWISFVAAKSSQKETKYNPVEHKTALIMKRAESFLEEGKGDMAETAYVMVITNFPSSPDTEKALRNLAEYNEGKGDMKRAAYYYSRFIKEFPDVPDVPEIRAKIAVINMEIMKSTLKTEDSIEYMVVKGDSLYAIAKKFNTTIGLVEKMNNLKTDVLQIGQKLKINTARFSVKVDKAKNILELKKDGELFKTYIVATGRNNSTPVGVFKVTDKMVEPVWTKPGVGMIMPGTEDYELGARWIPISVKGYGIHGTNDETSIGGQTTAGCVRMCNKDVIELFDIIPIGTEVEIIDSVQKDATPVPAEENKVSGDENGNNT